MPPAWLSRLMDRLRAAGDSADERRVRSVLLARDSFADEAGFLDALTAELGPAIDERTVEVVAAHLRGPGGEGLARIGPYLDSHLGFWAAVVARSESPLARACHADLLLLSGERDGALDAFLDALEQDPTLVPFRGELEQLARERGGEPWLRYRMACLRAALAGFRPGGEDDGADDDDYVRELYGELLEDHRGDAEALERIRGLGALIDQAVARGELPRAIVRRGPRP